MGQKLSTSNPSQVSNDASCLLCDAKLLETKLKRSHVAIRKADPWTIGQLLRLRLENRLKSQGSKRLKTSEISKRNFPSRRSLRMLRGSSHLWIVVSVSWRTWHVFLPLFPKSQRDEVFDELIFPPFSLEILEFGTFHLHTPFLCKS